MSFEWDTEIPSRVSTPDWFEYRTSNEQRVFADIERDRHSTQVCLKDGTEGFGEEDTGEKGKQIATKEKGKEVATSDEHQEWADIVEDEMTDEEEERVPLLDNKANQAAWPERKSSKEHFGNLMDFTTLSEGELTALKLPSTPQTMGDGNDQHALQRSVPSSSQPLSYHTPQPGPYTPLPSHQDAGQPSTNAQPDPFFQQPGASYSTSSFAPSVMRTPEAVFSPEITVLQQYSLNVFRQYLDLNSPHRAPPTEHNDTLLNYLRTYDFNIEVAAAGYDARMDRIRRTRARPSENASFIRRFNRGFGRR